MAKRRMRFVTWCKKDEDDDRKINYYFKTWNGSIMMFTSEDLMPVSMLGRLQRAWIEKIDLIDNEWHAHLYEAD